MDYRENRILMVTVGKKVIANELEKKTKKLFHFYLRAHKFLVWLPVY